MSMSCSKKMELMLMSTTFFLETNLVRLRRRIPSAKPNGIPAFGRARDPRS